ncbi:MAG: hypothetical protein HY208_05570 [Nitrospirae bacterium]|nr:hypothetical protein [Nitrospirota bacterium]
MTMISFRNTIMAAGWLFLWALSAFAADPPQKAAPRPEPPKPALPIESGRTATPLPQNCQRAQERSRELLTELEKTLSPKIKTAAEQYVARPGPGVSVEKAWGDFAAGLALDGDMPDAAWAGLKAALYRWTGETVTNAGVYLYELGKPQEALQLLLCAYDMGHRSPSLLEALATVHQKLGHAADARRAITAAAQLAPDDRLIETSAALINTGQPPPPAPPNQGDGLDEAVRELEQHGERILNQIKLQADAIDRSLPDAHAAQFYAISRTFVQSLLQNARDQVRAVRAADPRTRPFMINSVYGTLISSYANMTDTLLTFPGTTETNGSPLLFWAETLGLDAPLLARESRRDSITWSMHGVPGPALAQGAYDAFSREKERAYADHLTRERACRDTPCTTRERARWCGVWKPLYERWANDSRQRHDTAARSFDRVATGTLIDADNELLLTRDYAVRQVRKMTFQQTPGMDMKTMTLRGINQSLKAVFDKHLGAGAGSMGAVTYVRERVQWFEHERSSMEEQLAHEADDIKQECEPAMRALLELLAQEEWQAYLDHLRDRMAWDIQGQAETSEFPCEGTIGPLTIGTDLNKPGEGKVDLKWSRKGNPFSATGSVTLRQDQTFGLGVGVGAKTGSPGGGAGVSGSARDDLSKSGIGGGGGYGPFAGKASVTYTTKQSPWNSRDYLGIKLKGSAGLGLKAGQMGVACYPSSGSVTFYPRALYEDAVRYLSTPATPPGR